MRISLVWLILGFVFFTGCSVLKKSLEKPKVDLQNVDIQNATLTEAVFVFNFLVQNPNSIALNVDRVDYEVQFNGKNFTKGVMDKSFKVEGNATAEVSLPIQLKYSDIFSSVAELLSQRKAPYQIQGHVKMGVLSIPFKDTGEINLDNKR